ncbi:MAG: anti-anti-sigma regulatory factor [Bacteroidetes bacterium]|nr:MAG: anti-anti-sigma regulatory factor [Bacteroidota bacterium]
MNEPFNVERNDRYTLIRIRAEKLDSSISPALKSELVVMNADGVRNIIIDLTDSRYCDSSGLSAILVANRLCKNANGTFVITGLQDAVRKLISISQLDSILNISTDLTAAIDTVVEEEVERGNSE